MFASGGSQGAPIPYGPKSSQFHAVFRNGKIVSWPLPLGALAAPPTGNPGSAPVSSHTIFGIFGNQLNVRNEKKVSFVCGRIHI